MTTDLYNDLLTTASECVGRVREWDPGLFEDPPSLAAKNHAQAALALIQAAMTMKKAAAETKR